MHFIPSCLAIHELYTWSVHLNKKNKSWMSVWEIHLQRKLPWQVVLMYFSDIFYFFCVPFKKYCPISFVICSISILCSATVTEQIHNSTKFYIKYLFVLWEIHFSYLFFSRNNLKYHMHIFTFFKKKKLLHNVAAG